MRKLVSNSPRYEAQTYPIYHFIYLSYQFPRVLVSFGLVFANFHKTKPNQLGMGIETETN